MSDFIAQHQGWFDRKFPAGALASWQHRGNDTTYLVPRIIVTGQAGLDPLIWLPVFAGSDKTLGPFRMLSREDIQDHPYMIALGIDGVDDLLQLNAGVSEQAAAAMAAERQAFITLAPQGGPQVFDESPA